MKNTIAILGGGAAGMMAAIAAAEGLRGGRVLLFEKNKYLGAKVLISGGGRCNVTTGIFDVRKLMENYPRGAKFLMSAMFRFPPEKVKEWFESHGVPLKTEKDLRIFPVSDDGKDVVGTLENELRKLEVEIMTDANVVDVRKKDDDSKQAGHGAGPAENPLPRSKFLLTLKDGRTFEADVVIITTGGNAYRHTGSTGDGYAFAKHFGHTITPLSPSLNSFMVSEQWITKLAGVSFEKAGLTLENHDRSRTYTRRGPIVFTHHGVSGPAAFALSAAASYEQYDRNKPMDLFLDFFPDESSDHLQKRFMDLADKSGKKFLVNFLDMFLPRSLCSVFVEISKTDPELFTSKLGRDAREKILGLMKKLRVTVVGRGAGDEFVTAGGVALDEVNTNTMESKKQPGLYFAGEILDIDGFTGGFNLQASWATGKLAGEHAAKSFLL